MAIRQDLIVRQGEDFSFSFRATRNGQPIPLHSYVIEAQIRKNANSAEVIAEFDCAVLDADAGTFVLSMTADNAAEIPAGRTRFAWASRYVYDVRLSSPDGNIYMPIEGTVEIDPSVTR